MDVSIAEAYNKGRIAGANHYFSLRRDASLQLPKRPYSDALNTLSAGWNRGFINGFDQGKRGDFRFRSPRSDRRRATSGYA